MARKKKHEGHVNHERWLVSWADFMTLLFALFTALYAISTADPKKAGAMADSARAAFKMDVMQAPKPRRGDGGPNKNDPTAPRKPADDAPPQEEGKKSELIDMNATHEQRMLQAALKKLQSIVPTLPSKAGITIRQTRNTVVISLHDKAFFHKGSAQLLPQALPVLDKLATVLVGSQLYLRVEGHTDDRPTHTTRYTSNWDLSAARAVSVVRYLADEYAYPPEALAVAGYASGRPVASNETEAGRETNRRVDIVLLTAPEGSVGKLPTLPFPTAMPQHPGRDAGGLHRPAAPHAPRPGRPHAGAEKGAARP